jgi:histone deacetylase complex regulatory component SIN3
LKDKSKYGAITCKEWDSSLCDDVTPSYKTYPSDYPYEDFFTHSGQSAEDASVLNTSVICVRNEKRVSSSKLRLFDSLEEYDGIRIRKNVYEEALAKVEDERFEVDFAIETNASAMRQVQPLSEEVSMLKENEEKDNQPIGRLHYQVRPSHSLLSTHIGAIARLYGEQGDEVIHHLIRNPISVLPIVFKRLKDKDAEWRKIRVELTKQWRTICEANYDASLDATSYFHKRDIEKCFSHDSLVEECKRAFHYMKKPKEISKATESIAPSFSACHADSSMLLFHSHLSVNATQSMPYKDIYDCLAIQIQNFPAKTHVEKEKVSRIWTEFIAPWFNLPFYWFLNELRDKARSDKSPTIVQCKCVLLFICSFVWQIFHIQILYRCP